MTSFGQFAINRCSRLVPQCNVTVPLWENARFMLAEVPLKVEQAKKILPWGMKLTDPPKATVFIADYRKTGFTVPYKEAGVLVHVKTAFGTGYHCCWMPVDDDTALIYGRELLGYPKKLAKIEFEETPESIHASVTRRGVTVLSMQGTRGKPESNPAPVFDVKTFNVGGLGQLFAVSVVWLLRPIEVIHESYDADVTVALTESELDPLATFIEPRVHGRYGHPRVLLPVSCGHRGGEVALQYVQHACKVARTFTKKEYPTAGRSECAAYPFDTCPWDG